MSNIVLRIAALVSSFGILFGFGITSIAGLLEPLAREFNLDTQAQEILVSILVICCFFGAVLAGPMSGRLGRRTTMQIAAALMVLCYVVILGEPTYTGLLVARCGLGVAIGLSSMVVPMYAAEVTVARHRGAVVALFQLAITAGILFSYGISFLFVQTWPWFSVMGSGVVFAVAGWLLAISLPESPRWMMAKGNQEKARLISQGLGLRLDIGSDVTRPESNGADQTVSKVPPSRNKGNILSVLLLCAGLFVLQNLSGIDGILYYAPHIFQTMGFDPGKAALGATLGLGLVNFLATLVALRYVDTAGRRPLLLGGAAMMSIGMGMVALASVYQWPWIGLAGLCLFIVAFAVSLGPLPYVMMSELFPSAVRERGIAAASSISWLFNALIAFTFLSVVQWVGLTFVLLFFMSVCLLTFVIGLLYMPETKGADLERIEDNVLAGKRLRDLGQSD